MNAVDIFEHDEEYLCSNKCSKHFYFLITKKYKIWWIHYKMFINSCKADALSEITKINSTKFPRIDIYETMKYWMIIVQISTLKERTQRLQSYCWTFDALSENSCFELRCINPAILQLSIICQGISLYKDNKVMHSW